MSLWLVDPSRIYVSSCETCFNDRPLVDPKIHQCMGETNRMHGKMRNCDGTDARMLDVDSAADWLASILEIDTGSRHKRKPRNEATRVDLWIPKREVEGG
jgi:hypothetical protein